MQTNRYNDVEYFRSDSGALVACVGPSGVTAMFRLGRGDRQWEFLVPGSPTWNDIHQGIYRNMHVYDRVDSRELPSNLPPFPEIPKGPYPTREDYVLPKEPPPASSYPAVSEFLKAQKGEGVAVFVVLHEDGYETSCGDGEFHYFKNAFFDKDAAQRYMDRCPGEWDQAQRQWYRLHLRTMTIKLEHEVFVFPNFALKRYDDYTPIEVLKSLESHLSHETT